MFKKEGYLTPHDVCMTIFKASRHGTVGRSGPPQGCRWQYATTEFWNFTENLDHIYLMDRDGSIILADSYLAQSPFKSEEYGPLLRISSGILHGVYAYLARVLRPKWWRIWDWPFYYFMLAQPTRLERKVDRDFLGNFAGMAVVFPEAWVADYIKGTGEEDEPFESPSRPSEASVAQMIIGAFDAGEPMTRISARERFGPEMGSRSFARAWQRAAEQRPNLSLPGRRSL